MNINTPAIIESGFIGLEDSVSISFFELNHVIPFEVKRVYTISTAEKESLRGQHAHINQDQVIICINGSASASITSDSGVNYSFNINLKALYIPANHWIEINMQQYSTILCFSSQHYNHLISTFDKKKFLNQKI
jgi:hypothetical protein